MKSNVKTLVLVSLLSSAATLGAYKLLNLDKREVVFNESTPSAFTRMVSSNSPVAGAPGEFTYAAEKTTPAVVHIKTTMTRNVRQQMVDPFEFFGFGDGIGGNRGGSRSQKQEASGSGVIISADGYIVTNNHVVQDAEEVTVILNDRRELKAKVIATDPNTDLAVVQVQASNLPFLTFGNSDDIRVGEWVLAVGNPFNLESTVTAGIVSAKGRNINIIGDNNSADAPIESFIQTDAAVNPGNSGGALVNLKGELIGINTAIASGNGQFAGYSFAVPVSIVKKVTGDLLKYGNVQRGFLGISAKPVDGKTAMELDLKVNSGVYIAAFTENSSAKASGLKIGDVIVKIDGVSTNAYSQLTEIVGRHKPGEAIVVTVNRDGVEKDFNVVLKNRDGNTALLKNEPVASVNIAILGAKFSNLSDADKTRLKLQSGIKVIEVDPNGRLAYNGVEKGFIITKIDNKPVNSVKEAAEMLDNRKGQIRIEGTDPQEPSSRYIIVM